MAERIYIFDTTLRDGEQAPGYSMNLEEKIRVARQLETLGVDIIEAGFAMQGDEMPESWIRVKRLLAHIREERGPFSGEWKQVMEDARRDIEEQQDEEMCRYFADLYEGVSVYQEYRHFHDYKETDGVLIAHIPEILRGF